LNPLSAVYGRAARARREWYVRHPRARRRLRCPVISVGNLVVGGSGKTPVVAALASILRDGGYRPAIVSRGYARRDTTDAVTVVSDGSRILEPVERSGDEPQMLARRVAGVPVLVAADRYAAGLVAEERFGCTVVVLDDGFQHVQLARDVDLLLVDDADLGERVLPVGRLREPLEAAQVASAVLVHGNGEDAVRIARALGIAAAFTVERHYESPRLVSPWSAPATTPGRRVVAVAGIARPQRFFAAVKSQGWEVVRELAFRDHRWFTPADLARMTAAARDERADLILTTEKDAVRLERWSSDWMLAYLPMHVSIEPAGEFARLVMRPGVTLPGRVAG
jgi:tetraacyldisaccharide 4'-kinase